MFAYLHAMPVRGHWLLPLLVVMQAAYLPSGNGLASVAEEENVLPSCNSLLSVTFSDGMLSPSFQYDRNLYELRDKQVVNYKPIFRKHLHCLKTQVAARYDSVQRALLVSAWCDESMLSCPQYALTFLQVHSQCILLLLM